MAQPRYRQGKAVAAVILGPGVYEDVDGNRRWEDSQGRCHRDSGPAIEWASGTLEWWRYGRRHREDGPAVVGYDGWLEWWVDGHPHREGGPAVEMKDGRRMWWQNGQRHREDGPAVERRNGDHWWFLDGQKLSEEEWRAAMQERRMAATVVSPGQRSRPSALAA